ncbi:MAG: alpha-galactosidase [Eubacteriales bacterium]
MQKLFSTLKYEITAGPEGWTYISGGRFYTVSWPVLELNGLMMRIVPDHLALISQTDGDIISEKVFAETGVFEIIFRYVPESAILRFKYRITPVKPVPMTKADGRDAIEYFRITIPQYMSLNEIRFSEFYENIHSYKLTEQDAFAYEESAMGPIITALSVHNSVLMAYEHGSQFPDRFLEYVNNNNIISLHAVKGNYLDGEIIDEQHPYETVWMEFGEVDGGKDALAKEYRKFWLEYVTPNQASRKPYIYYNTWNFQERSKWWYHHAYLDSMNEERMLSEIEAAHKIGIDVFVMDTGWYEKTGDWRASSLRFPKGLGPILDKLAGYGMKLGLWFDPTAAAVSSTMFRKNKRNITEWNGSKSNTREIWETEASHSMCLVSDYWEDFADELIRISREWGVTYFKWDAIGQYVCDSPSHRHGNTGNSIAERRDNYAFKQVLFMTKIINKLCSACPEAIVDFDITESGRSVGLAFLTSGKYFLINNGPYFGSYNVPVQDNPNLFFYPGPARAWVCRTPLSFDAWIPSVLFLTHYLPDDPIVSQRINIASLILGQNGIWGDLLHISAEGAAYIGKMIFTYKKVCDDITAAYPVTFGEPSGGFEIHEKINTANGRGAVAAFSNCGGVFSYRTSNYISRDILIDGDAQINRCEDGTADITFHFTRGDACIIWLL